MLTKGDLKAIENVVELKLKSELRPINKRLNKIDKKLDKTIDFFDVRELKIVSEVKKIQAHLKLPVMEFV